MILQRFGRRRAGSVIPLVAICIATLFACVALAIDLGLMAVTRVQLQAAVDAGALAGVRNLNADPAIAQSTVRTNGIDAAKTAVTLNSVISKPLVITDVQAKSGIYYYDSTATPPGFKPLTADSATNPITNGTENWSSIWVQATTVQPTYFAKTMGITQFSMTTTATAVHRPRDLAIILDMSGSMMFGSWGHKTSYVNGAGGNFLSYPATGSNNPDPHYPQFGHWSTMSTVMTSTTGFDVTPDGFLAANNWTMDSAQNGPAIAKDFVYDLTGVTTSTPYPTSSVPVNAGNLSNAFYTQTSADTTWSATATISQPAPLNFKDQSDSPVTYSGDKWPRFNKGTTGSYAHNVEEYLSGTTGNATSSTRDVTFETTGYGATFNGYSMGPGYYGKTFFYWPPDPRAPVGQPDVPATFVPGDWRNRYFGTTDNSVLFNSSNMLNYGSFTINYASILKWIKYCGPKVFPPNLRAGRVLYYSHIPDDVDTSTGTADQKADKAFWMNYIDYVLGNTGSQRTYTLYGIGTNAWNGNVAIKLTGSGSLSGTPKPYMHYNDIPPSPRLNFWFGPYTMMHFTSGGEGFNYIGRNYNTGTANASNWWAGTVHEAQDWHLKAGVNSALSDIQKNHPNDWATLLYFGAISQYATPRVKLGRQYELMKDALFFPFSLCGSTYPPSINTQSSEVRPYTVNGTALTDRSRGEIPNAYSGTGPELSFKGAYNEFSTATGYNGRRGAAKLVIFETDGIPNSYGDGTFTGTAPYQCTYTSLAVGGGYPNNDPTGTARAIGVVSQIVAADTNAGLGYSGGTTARVHAIGFGDLFEAGQTSRTAALDFLLKVQKAGNTSASSDTSIETFKIITGTYDTRIANLRDAFQRIMQSGVQVSLIRGTAEN